MSGRYMNNDFSTLYTEEDPQTQLVQSLTKIVRGYPPQLDQVEDFHGLYSGPTSVAYLFLWVSQAHPDLKVDDVQAIHWGLKYANISQNGVPAKPGRCGIGCEELAALAVRCVFSAALGAQPELETLDIFEKRLIKLLILGGSNEWLYGCAGMLYLLRMVKHWVPSTSNKISQLQRRIIDHILTQGPPWSWHGKNYLGAVHGDIGIVTQIILSIPSYASDLSSDLSKLLDMQDSAGNWPSSASSHHSDLVQFCHGAPGFIFSLSALRPHFPSLHARIDSSIERARHCIWERGLLVKEPNLCHGITGNALALQGKQRAHFMAFTVPGYVRKNLECGSFIKGDDPWGLFCGEAGRAWGWLALSIDKELGMIGYTDV